MSIFRPNIGPVADISKDCRPGSCLSSIGDEKAGAVGMLAGDVPRLNPVQSIYPGGNSPVKQRGLGSGKIEVDDSGVNAFHRAFPSFRAAQQRL